MAGNSNLNSAKTARKDEFYTQLTDIEKEMRYYRKHFQGKTVLCNCDDPFESNFFKYFALNFNRLGLKKIRAWERIKTSALIRLWLLKYMTKRVTAVWTCWMWQNCSAPVKMSWWSWRAMAISVRLNA